MTGPASRGGPTAPLQVQRVWRVENSDLWYRYAEQKFALKLATRLGDAYGSVRGLPTERPASTAGRGALDTAINEVYLWHGLSPDQMLTVKRAGFGRTFSGAHEGTPLGDGIYFTDSLTLADGRSSADTDGIFEGCCAMILCRVALGRTATVEAHQLEAVRAALEAGADSIVGKCPGTSAAREFVVFSNARCYPEYLIIYKREGDMSEPAR